MRLAATGSSLAVEERRAVKWNNVGARGLGVGGACRVKNTKKNVKVEVEEIHCQDQRGLVAESTSGEIGKAVEFSDAPD